LVSIFFEIPLWGYGLIDGRIFFRDETGEKRDFRRREMFPRMDAGIQEILKELKNK
jgi:hypothetical protein